MARVGEMEGDFLDAERVRTYLDGGWRVMVLRVGREMIVKIDVDGLIERLTDLAVCMGDMVGDLKW